MIKERVIGVSNVIFQQQYFNYMYIMTISFISGEKNREKKLCPQDTIKPL